VVYSDIHVPARRAKLRSLGTVHGGQSHRSRRAGHVGSLAFVVDDTRHILGNPPVDVDAGGGR